MSDVRLLFFFHRLFCVTLPFLLLFLCQTKHNILYPHKINELRHEMMCQFCGNSICIAVSMGTYLTSMSTCSAMKKIFNNRKKQNFLYVKASKKLMGTLGYRNHKRLPECIVNLVRDLFPDENNNYVGFQQHNAFHSLSDGRNSFRSNASEYKSSQLLSNITGKHKPNDESLSLIF